MAILLAMARDSLSWPTLGKTDMEKALVGCYRKGDIVEVRENGAPFGSKETLPDFIIVNISDADKSQMIEYSEMWKREIGTTVLSFNDKQYEVYLSAASMGSVSNAEELTDAQVKKWLKIPDGDILDNTKNNILVKLTLKEKEVWDDRNRRIKGALEFVRRRKWSILDSEVDDIISLGGITELTKKQFETKVYSKLTTLDGN